MKNSKRVFLLPEIIDKNDRFTIFQSAELFNDKPEPIEVKDFAVYTFIKRLDQAGFQFYAITAMAKNKHAYLYRHYFTQDEPNFKKLNMNLKDTDDGIIVYLDMLRFDELDESDQAVRIKGGDWVKVSDSYHQKAALYHLGIIPDLSPPVFSMSSSLDRWVAILYNSFGTNGELSEALKKIFERIKFAAKIFNITSVNTVLEQYRIKDDQYCFGVLIEPLKTSVEMDVIDHIIPISHRITSRFFILNQFLRIIYDVLVQNNAIILSVDDFSNFSLEIERFQKKNDLPSAAETLKRLLYMYDFKINEPLPIFRMAGIDVNYDQIIDFPTMKLIESNSNTNPLGDKVRERINKVIISSADPKLKIEWMNNKIFECAHASDERSAELSQKVDEIEKKVSIMTGMLKDIVQETQSATSRVKIASKTLSTIYDSHVKIQGKFDILRETLFSEQKNARMLLLIAIFISFVGIFEFFKR